MNVTPKYPYEDADFVAFERLKNARFLKIDGNFYLDSLGVNEESIREQSAKYGASATQKLYNHQHLSQYTADYALQQIWAKALTDMWTQHIKQRFPEANFAVDIEDNGAEIIVTLVNH
jgi:hypothetical protein